MIRADRELLAEMARVNCDVTPLAMRIMDGSVTAEEQCAFAERLVTMAHRLRIRASDAGSVVDGEIVNPSAPQGGVQQRPR